MEDKLSVTVNYDGKKVTWDMPFDLGLDDMKQLFTEIMIFMTWTPEQVKELFNDDNSESLDG